MIDWLRQDLSPSVMLGARELPLAIRRHPNARRMTMRLAPDGSEVRITLPRWGRTAEAIAFARARADWLQRQLATLPQASPPTPGGTIQFRGQALRIDWSPAHPRTPAPDAKCLRIGGPAESLPACIHRWLEAEALRLIAHDLPFYCERAGTPVPALALSRAQRRWGSCSPPRLGTPRSSESTIRINWRLVQAPDAVRRSVVAHEVAHLVHFDHSPAFHRLLTAIFEGDLAAADRWLKQEGRSLYASFG